MGGEGADELLAGYYWRYPQLFDLSDKSTALEIAWELWRSTRHTSRKDLVSFKDMNSAKQIFSASFTTCVNESSPDTLPLDHFMTFQIRHYLHFLLLQSDKLVSSVGMEGRFPFLDYDLSDYILSLPLSIRYRPDVPLAKPLLREAMAGLVPPNIIERQKRGFVPPESFWYRNQLQPLIQKWICSPDAHYKEYLNEVVVGNIVNLHSRSIVDASKLIWAILVFEIWHKIFIENEDMTKIRAI